MLGLLWSVPKGPSTIPSNREGRRQAAISKYLVSHRQARPEAPNQDGKVGHSQGVPQTLPHGA